MLWRWPPLYHLCSTTAKEACLRMALARRTPAIPTRLLAIILASYLMIVLDVSIVITALPEIHRTLGFSSTGLSWVQNAYTLAFGGLLLLGARAGDLLGRRACSWSASRSSPARRSRPGSPVRGLAAGRPGRAGRGRCDRGALDARAADDELRRRPGADARGRLLRRRRGRRRQCRAGAGRPPHGVAVVACRSLHQRADRDRPDPGRPRYLPETERRPGRFDLAGARRRRSG